MNYHALRILFLKRFTIPKEYAVRRILRSLTIAEKAVFYFFAAIFIISGIALLWTVNRSFLVEVPTRGGTIIEGVIGNPRFINPVLSISEADKNLVAIIYSGLIRITPSGDIENDLASEITISDDRLTYTAHIRDDARFHDGEKVTADDVIFTIQKILDPVIKSPRRGNWDGVNVEKVDDETVAFTLKQAYNPFIYNLAIGILPRHIWKNVSPDEFSFSQFNTFPIGSGPYKVNRVERNSGGIPNYYKLVPADELSRNAPFIKNLIFKFFSNAETLIAAYNERVIESLSGISPNMIEKMNTKGSRIVSAPLPRVFAVFINQNQSKALLNVEVRRALDLASPKKEIVENILSGFGMVINGPLPAGVYDWTNIKEDATTTNERLEEARDLLAKALWQINPNTGVLEKKSKSDTIQLSFSISTGDAPELQAVANELKTAWEKLGARIEIKVFETGDLNQEVIRPRNFDTLLFGEVVGRDVDLYPFWHSSQRGDPGLNIALYANNRADKLLESARSTNDKKTVEKNYQEFAKELKTDMPAIFLYTPGFLYVVPSKVEAINLGSLAVSQDRFLGIRDWYIEKDRVWKIFTN